MKYLIGLISILGSIIVFILPTLKRKNNELNQKVKQQDNLINSLKENEKIKQKNSKLSKSELIDKL